MLGKAQMLVERFYGGFCAPSARFAGELRSRLSFPRSRDNRTFDVATGVAGD